MPVMRRSPQVARAVEAAVGDLGGVEKVEANPLTASVLVCYDPKRIGQANVLAALRAANTPAPRVSQLDRGHSGPGSAAADTSLLTKVVTSVGVSLVSAGIRDLIVAAV
jgi:copper chaperone CopZ